MKRTFKISLLVAVTILASVQGCNDILEENPKTTFTNAYFETKQGLQDGINAAYAYLRFQYGTNPALGLNVVGTDEFTFGPEPNYNGSGDNLPHKQLGQYTLSPSHGFLLVTYNRTFPIINMLNGLLEFAPNVPDLSESERTSILAQARYLRAHYYYFLVGQFGASPVDLGGGDFKFNRVPYTGFNRLDPDLLSKNYQVMIEDLTFASENLRDARPDTEFRLSKAVALHLLAKIYLFRGYSEVAEGGDFQNAYNAAKKLIDGQAGYGATLLPDFGDAYKQSMEYNREILFAAERIPMDDLNNEYTNPSGIGDRENMAASCFTSNYEQPVLLQPANGDPIGGRPFNFQRPLRKLAPTKWLMEVAFADKVNDSRYHNSFRTLFTVDTQEQPGTPAYTTFVNTLAAMTPARALGDTAFYLADSEAQALSLGGKYYRVYKPSEFYNNILYPPGTTNPVLVYPSLKKFNDSQRAHFNNASGRPMPIFKFAETYLIAAEAAFQLNDKDEAAELINVIRRRAAYRPSRPGLDAGANAQANEDAAAAMEIEAADVTLDFILDERARELCGESLRWVDLALRGPEVFVNRVRLNEDAQGVQAFHRMRPIPQQQLDAIDDPDKEIYQNDGY